MTMSTRHPALNDGMPPRRSRRAARLHVATIAVDWLIPDLEIAYCSDRRGRKYTIDRRSAVSFSALSEGLRLRVCATDHGLVKSLAFDDE